MSSACIGVVLAVVLCRAVYGIAVLGVQMNGRMGRAGIIDDLIILLIIDGLQRSRLDPGIRNGMLDDLSDIVFIQPDG